jgi:hypothetical protein
MMHWVRPLIAALLVPLALTGCLFIPGKFESTLDIRADRSFTFTYKGEVQALDIKRLTSKAMTAALADKKKAASEPDAGGGEDDGLPGTTPTMPDILLTPDEKAERDAEFRELAAQVAKEAGYRSIEYRGEGRFYVDYAISGTLTHGFAFPYNQDAQMLAPFVVIELRGKDVARIKAPGFARQDASAMSSMGALGAMSAGMSDGMSKAMLGFDPGAIDGSFTLTTDAEIVSQNNEDGAKAAGARRTVRWKVNSRTKEAPAASLRLRALP